MAGEDYHAAAHAVRVDVLALGGSRRDRDHSEVCAHSGSGLLCRLDRAPGLRRFGRGLHGQDDLRAAFGFLVPGGPTRGVAGGGEARRFARRDGLFDLTTGADDDAQETYHAGVDVDGSPRSLRPRDGNRRRGREHGAATAGAAAAVDQHLSGAAQPGLRGQKRVFDLDRASTRLTGSIQQQETVMVSLQKGAVTATCWVLFSAWNQQSLEGNSTTCNVLH